MSEKSEITFEDIDPVMDVLLKTLNSVIVNNSDFYGVPDEEKIKNAMAKYQEIKNNQCKCHSD